MTAFRRNAVLKPTSETPPVASATSLTSVADYSSVKCLRQKCTWLRSLCVGAPSCWYYMRDKSVRKLHLLKNRLTVQVKFPYMILVLKVHRNILDQLRCSSTFRTTHSLGGDSVVLDVGFEGPIMLILCINSALPRKLHSSNHKTSLKIWISSSGFNSKLQKSKRHFWFRALLTAPGLDDKDMHRTYVICSTPSILSRNKPC
ncbi:uncharacterized protein TNCV_1573211 [Trichonephila clavipes]|uniref:Uncharacterized protein n=1 Tax=Trichonephila clavipes TaxID=2585209 RepID=A0A8X6SQD3_TRICX|nr:uncharacterized protein TNCV_1573211 [Trichonephila clavipes]